MHDLLILLLLIALQESVPVYTIASIVTGSRASDKDKVLTIVAIYTDLHPP